VVQLRVFVAVRLRRIPDLRAIVVRLHGTKGQTCGTEVWVARANSVPVTVRNRIDLLRTTRTRIAEITAAIAILVIVVGGRNIRALVDVLRDAIPIGVCIIGKQELWLKPKPCGVGQHVKNREKTFPARAERTEHAGKPVPLLVGQGGGQEVASNEILASRISDR
jgi:hypothetical protein